MIIDCRALAAKIDRATKEVNAELRRLGRIPKIVEIVASDNDSVHSYASTKSKKARNLGAAYEIVTLPPSVDQLAIAAVIKQLNADSSVHGIILGLPVHKHLDVEGLLGEIDPGKDVDGLTPKNTYQIATNQEHLGIVPATAAAAIHVIQNLLPLRGKNVLVIGRGRTVGGPVAAMLTNRDATVTLAHSKSVGLESYIRTSEIIVTATGSPGLIDSGWFHSGQVVVDCGIAYHGGRLCGDVDSDILASLGVIVSPVPGGVGAITNSMIFANLLRAISLASGLTI